MHGMISIATFNIRLNQRFVLLLKQFLYATEKITKASHSRKYVITSQNGAGSNWQHRSDLDPIWHNMACLYGSSSMCIIQPSYHTMDAPLTHLRQKIDHYSK